MQKNFTAMGLEVIRINSLLMGIALFGFSISWQNTAFAGSSKDRIAIASFPSERMISKSPCANENASLCEIEIMAPPWEFVLKQDLVNKTTSLGIYRHDTTEEMIFLKLDVELICNEFQCHNSKEQVILRWEILRRDFNEFTDHSKVLVHLTKKNRKQTFPMSVATEN